MKIGYKIKEAREAKQLTQNQLVKISGVSRRSLQLYESDGGNITLQNLQKIADALNLDVGFFVSSKISPQTKEDCVRIPSYENEIPAQGEEKFITFSKSYLREFVGIYTFDNLCFIKSTEDSMHPTIPTNSNVIIQYGQPKNGEICLTRIDNQLYIRRFQKLPKMRLLSDNTNYEPIDLQTQNYEIIGKVLFYIKCV